MVERCKKEQRNLDQHKIRFSKCKKEVAEKKQAEVKRLLAEIDQIVGGIELKIEDNANLIETRTRMLEGLMIELEVRLEK